MKSVSSRLGLTASALVAALSMIVSSLVFIESAAAEVANPDLDARCDLDISLILDASGSIEGFGAVQDIRDLGHDLVSALADRSVKLSVIEFGTFGDVAVPSTPVTSATVASVFDPYFAGSATPGYYDGRVGNYTNWEDGLRLAGELPERPDLVLFVSDGTPNTVGTATTAVEGNAASPEEAAAAAAIPADAMKEAGAHITAIGVAGLNDDTGVGLLKLISGQDDVDDVGIVAGDFVTGEFDRLGPLFSELLAEICGGTLVVRSLVDGDGDLTTVGDQAPAEGWTILPTTQSAVVLNQSSPTTDAAGVVLVEPEWTEPGQAIQLVVSQPTLPGFYVGDAYCSDRTGAGWYDEGFRLRGLVLDRGSLATCTFVNIPLDLNLDFDLKIDWIDDVDQSGDNSPGDVIHYRGVATNTGGGPLSNVMMHSQLIEWDICDQGSSLDVQHSLTCWGTHAIAPGEDQILHHASATADGVAPVSDAELTRLPIAQLSFDKTIIDVDDLDGSGDTSVGDVVHFDLVAVNIGEANLTGVVVNDPTADDVSCQPAGPATLRPGQAVTCRGTIAIDAEHQGRPLANLAEATSDQTGPVSDEELLFIPNLNLRFNTVITSYDDNDDNGSPSRGDVVHVLNVPTNTGTSNLTGVAVTDDRSDDVVCDVLVSWMRPGDVLECEGSFTVGQADHGTTLMVTGEVTSRQTGEVYDADSIVVPRAELDVTTTLLEMVDNDLTDDPSPGDDLIFRFVAVNTGEMTLTRVNLRPSGVDDYVCDPFDRLAVGEFVECLGFRTVTEADLGRDLVATARGTSWQAPPDEDDAVVPVGRPSATISNDIHQLIDLDGNGRPNVGDQLELLVVATNDGTANLASSVVTNTLPDPSACTYPPGFDVVGGPSFEILRPGEQIRCIVTHDLVLADVLEPVWSVATLDSPQLPSPVRDNARFELPPIGACSGLGVGFEPTDLLGGGGRTVTTAVDLPAGRYRLGLVSADEGHRAGHQMAQVNERWFIELLDRAGNVVATSPATADLNDADRIAGFVVAADFTVPYGVTAVRARHVGSRGVDSITPVCAGFDLIEAAPELPYEDPGLPYEGVGSGLAACPAGSMVFENVILVGWKKTHDVSFDLAAGTYSVSVVSQDLGHAPGHQRAQTAEQWRIEFLDASDQVVASTGLTPDLREDMMWMRSVLADSIQLNGDVVRMRLVHREGPGADSIQPLCVSIRSL